MASFSFSYVQDNDGGTPLYEACAWDLVECVAELLRPHVHSVTGAMVSCMRTRLCIALHFAAADTMFVFVRSRLRVRI